MTKPASDPTRQGPRASEAHASRSLDDASDSLAKRRSLKEDERLAGKLKGQRVRSKTERLLTRTTSGVIYALCILVCLYLGRFATALLVAMMSWLCCSEFYRIVRMGGRMPNEFMGLAAAVLYPVAALVGKETANGVTLLLVLAVGTWYVLTPRANVSDASVTVFGPIYTGLLFSSVVTIRMSDPGTQGALLTLGVMGSVWINDALAYLVGSRLGRHRLAPRISPNKSWEGLFGGLVGSCGTWLAIMAIGVQGVTLPLAMVAGLLCGIAGVAGDLFESRLKRAVGVKDSGNLMPGHGGLLDRSDSMLFASMTAYFVLHLGGVL